jgi:hypothetical protein
MNGDQITFRLPPALKARIRRDAAERGITRTSWIVHLIERGQLTDSLEQFLARLGQSEPPAPSRAGAVPPVILERVLFAVCFSEALLKKLNASLNRSTSELGSVAAQARDQARAETSALLKALQG